MDEARQYEDQLGIGDTSTSIVFSYDALQHIYDKHARNFGLSGNRNKTQLDALKAKIDEHLADPNTTKITGEWHGQPAEMYYNPQTQNVIITDTSGNLITGFRLSPAQVGYLTTTGRLN